MISPKQKLDLKEREISNKNKIILYSMNIHHIILHVIIIIIIFIN